MKREAYIKQLESEKYELKEQLKTVSKEREEQSEGWKKEKNKTLELMFSKCRSTAVIVAYKLAPHVDVQSRLIQVH